MTTTQAAKTAIFYTPHVGNQIPLYNGTAFVMTAFTELTVATTDTANSPAAIGVSKVNDWFIWDSGGGVLKLVHGPDWTNDTARSAGTAIERVQGLWVNSVAITNGPAIRRGTYVGTTRSNASAQLDWVLGSSAAGGGAAFLGVWNCYNRVNIVTTVSEATANWVVNSLLRPLNNSVNNRVSAVFGLAEDEITAFVNSAVNIPTSVNGTVGIGFNSTTVLTGIYSSAFLTTSGWVPVFGQYSCSALGFNFWQAMEWGGAGSNSFAGNFPTVACISGLNFRARM